MQLDQNLVFCQNMSLVGAPGTYKCTKTVKLQAAQAIPPFTQTGGPHDIGMGTPVQVVVKMKDAADSAGGAAKVKAQLVMADDADLVTNPVVLAESEEIPEATLVAGYEFRSPQVIPAGATKLHIGVQFVTSGEALTSGTVSAAITRDRDSAAFV